MNGSMENAPGSENVDLDFQHQWFRRLTLSLVTSRKRTDPDFYSRDWVVQCHDSKEAFAKQFPDRQACFEKLRSLEEEFNDIEVSISETIERIQRTGLTYLDREQLHYGFPMPDEEERDDWRQPSLVRSCFARATRDDTNSVNRGASVRPPSADYSARRVAAAKQQRNETLGNKKAVSFRVEIRAANFVQGTYEGARKQPPIANPSIALPLKFFGKSLP